MTPDEDRRLTQLAYNRDGHAVACLREYERGEIPMPSLSMWRAAEKRLEDFQTELYLASKSRKGAVA